MAFSTWFRSLAPNLDVQLKFLNQPSKIPEIQRSQCTLHFKIQLYLLEASDITVISVLSRNSDQCFMSTFLLQERKLCHYGREIRWGKLVFLNAH